ncbi:putative transposable element [Pseudoloma neurophilia]|uniref:Putative transposable element n=1 Tax=Pseudoloma neurophilia TaxID=146866 RepID=A0A0R0M4L9_9MICR|nr:putative transposable element [Pseudoloma neurophilia]
MPFRGLSIKLNYKYSNMIRFLRQIKKTPKKKFKKIQMIRGENIIVEIDESKFGKRNYRGQFVEGKWFLGLVENTKERKMILIPVKKRDSTTLLQIIKKYVHPQSVIHTDKWRQYNDLKNHFRDHKTVNHSEHYKNQNTGVHTNTIKGNCFL